MEKTSPRNGTVTPLLVVQVLAYLLVLKATVAILLVYRDYFPPDFRSDFLMGHDGHFFGPYAWAFYTHILSSPFALLTGLMLVNGPVRRRFPLMHRRLGRAHAACALGLVAPSGLLMAQQTLAGPVAAAGFSGQAIATALCAAMGWRAAVGHRMAEHRRWMLRCFMVLCSAVVLRVIGGLSQVLGADWTYPYAAWLSWLLPLAVLETLRVTRPAFPLRQSSTTP